MIAQTLSQLRQLKLTCMASALQTQQEQPGAYEGLSFAECLQLLVGQETQERQQRKQERLIRTAQFKSKPTPKASITSILAACSQAKWRHCCSATVSAKRRTCC